MSVAQRLYEGVETPDGQVGLITYMRTDSVAHRRAGDGRGARGHRRALRRPRTRCPRAGVYKTKSKSAQEAHEAIRPTSFRARPGLAGAVARSRRARLYRLIWQRALRQPDDGEGARDHDGRAGRRPVRACGRARRGRVFDGFAAVYTEGRDDARRGGGARRLPPLAEGDVTTVGRRHPDPALHRAAAALHRGDPDQGARGARHRPAVDLRRDDLDDRRPRLRARQGAAPPPRAGRRGRHRPAGRALRRLRRPRVHRPDGGGARRGRPRRARLGAAAARRSTRRSGRSSTRSARSSRRARLHDRADRRGLLARATRWSSGSGRNGRFLACSLYPEHKESRPLPGRGGRRARRCPASGEPCPKCGDRGRDARRTSAAGSGRSSAARATRTATTSRRTARRRRSRSPFEVACPKCGEGHLVARRARRTGIVFWGCSRYPKCDFTTSREPLGARPRRRRGPGRAQGRGRRDVPRRAARRSTLPAAAIARRRARSPAGRRTRRPSPGRRGAAGAGRRGGGGRAAAAARRGATGVAADARTRRPAAPRTERDARGVTGARRPRPVPARPRRPRRLAAHPARLRDGGRRLPRLARRARRRLARARRGASCAPTWPTSAEGHARTSVAQRLAAIRSFYRCAARDGLGAGDPWGAIATPRQPTRLPRVLEVDAGRAAARAVVDEDARRRAGAGTPAAGAAAALALRDRALVETAYAAGLRISELAAADARRRSTSGGARSGCSARAARSGSGCSAGRPGRRSPAYLDDGRPVLLARRAPAPAGDDAAARGLPEPPRRAARRPRAPLPARPAPARAGLPDGVSPHTLRH